jgi:uncharacterized membrane protein
MKKRTFLIFAILFLFIPLITGVISEELISEDLTSEQKAQICLEKSEMILQELNVSGFSIQRAGDTFKKIETTFYSQKILKEKGGAFNFSLVLPFCTDMEDLKENALGSRDAFNGLMKFYNETFDKNVDTSSVDKLISEITKEISNERYELVPPLINSAYEEILKVKSENTALKLFYSSTTKGLGNFFKNNLVFFVVFFVVLLFIFIFYKTAIIRFELKKKINYLEWRKESLRDLIKKAQKDYFEKGVISESDYAVKTQNFAEMIRDLDRQIPMLKEELAKHSQTKSSKKKTPSDFGMIGKAPKKENFKKTKKVFKEKSKKRRKN